MAKPKSSNRSIRLTDEMWAWLNAEADRRATSVNGLVGDLLLVARLKAAERESGVVRVNDDGLIMLPKPHISVPASAPETFKAALGLPVGPVARKPGDLLKKGKK